MKLHNKIVVIEDNDVDYEVLSSVLITHDPECRIRWIEDLACAENFIEELANAESDALPDLMFLDLHLHGNPTFGFLSKLKMLDETNHIPIIIFSSSDRASNVRECYRRGANGYLLKTMDWSEMSKRAEIVLKYWFDAVLF